MEDDSSSIPVQTVLGQIWYGVVKSFSPKAGWGFIKGDGLIEDVFVSFNSCPNLRGSDFVGQRVKFMPVESATKHGSFEAKTCELLDEVNEFANVGKWLDATVKNWNPTAGWGFLTSSRVPRDIFISKRLCPLFHTFNPKKGMVVRVKVGESKSNPGTFEAAGVELKTKSSGNDIGMGAMGMGGMSREDIQAMELGRAVMQLTETLGYGEDDLLKILGDTTGGNMQEMGGYASLTGGSTKTASAPYRKPAPKASQSNSKLIGETATGVIKSFVPSTGWGFVTSDTSFDDCFFNIKGNPQLSDFQVLLQPGQPVTYTVQQSASRPGRLEAVDIIVQ